MDYTCLPADIQEQLKLGYYYSQAFVDYSKIYFSQHQDQTLIVRKGERILAFMPVFSIEQAVSCFGIPLRAYLVTGLSSDDRKYAIAQIEEHLDKLLDDKSYTHALLGLELMNFLGAYKVGDRIDVAAEQWIDLTQEMPLLLQDVRKSYRSLINWGRNNLKTEVIDHRHFDRQKLENFRLFHIQVAGRETRSPASWHEQWNMINNNQGFLTMSYLDGELVSGALFLHGTQEALYGVAVNNRELMAKKMAIGHYPVWKGIEYAKEIGLKSLNMGIIGPELQHDKDRQIALFKRGFGSKVVPQCTYRYGKSENPA